MSKLSVNNTYFTPVKKRTSIGHSSRSRPKNKSKRANFKKYNRQGKWVVALNGERMTETKTTTQASSDYQIRLLQEVNKKCENRHYMDKEAASMKFGASLKSPLICSPFTHKLEYDNGHKG